MSANGKGNELSPRQLAFKEAYLHPESDTFSNAYRSALKAGFEKEYAKKITGSGTDWFAEIIRDHERLCKAEKVLDEMLQLSHKEPQFAKLKQDTAKFVAKTMGREKYAERTETDLTTKGESMNFVSERAKELAKEYEEKLKSEK